MIVDSSVVIALGRRTEHPELALEFDRFLDWARARVEPITAAHARLAREAHRSFAVARAIPPG